MYSTYRLKADELTSEFLQALKKTYKHRDIEIIVQEIEDETDYLLRSSENKEHLLAAIKNIENHSNLINISVNDL